MKMALLIIDMINEYLEPSGKIYCEKGCSIIPNIKKLRKYFHEKNNPVIYINTSHINGGDPETQKWGLHAMRGTWGDEVVKELEPTEQDILLYKRTYDGFYNTELEITLRSLKVDSVLVCGIHTHVCVLCTALGAFYRGFNVYALSDCMTTGYQPNHDSRLRFYESHIGTLTNLEKFLDEDLLSSE